ncbi:MAG TPA: cytochrome c1 [Rhizomicrobium sp.]
MKIALPLFVLAFGLSFGSAAADNSAALPPRHMQWSFAGPFGTYDRGALQRGFKVYKEVCAACHGLDLVAFHDLANPGGPGFTEAQAKAIAAGYRIPAEPNDKGEIFDANGNRLTRPGILADRFPPPFPNEEAARASNNGSLPPDLSLIAKAHVGGPDYLYSLLVGFGHKPPKDFKVLEGKYYNPYFAGRNIAMPPPLMAGSVSYPDGTKTSVAQEAHDVVTFLAWAAEPKLEERHRIGFQVMAFLVLLAGLLFLTYRKVWKGEH